MRNVCFFLLAAFIAFTAAVTAWGEAPGSSHVKIGGKPCAVEKDPQGDVIRISVLPGIFLSAGGAENSGGRIGLSVGVAPETLAGFLGAEFADLID